MFSIFYIFIVKSKFRIRILLEINFSSCRQFRDTWQVRRSMNSLTNLYFVQQFEYRTSGLGTAGSYLSRDYVIYIGIKGKETFHSVYFIVLYMY